MNRQKAGAEYVKPQNMWQTYNATAFLRFPLFYQNLYEQ
jgi:hypothetical protein